MTVPFTKMPFRIHAVRLAMRRPKFGKVGNPYNIPIIPKCPDYDTQLAQLREAGGHSVPVCGRGIPPEQLERAHND